jgi:uncharacterized protein (DUF885 family)
LHAQANEDLHALLDNIRAFHYAIIGSRSFPLAVLEEVIKQPFKL